MKKISRILIANRGEIAVRVVRACKELGIESVVAVSDADRNSLPASMADKSVCIGSARPKDSYLKVNTLISAALGTGSDAIHPGYGFLSEQPELAESCAKYGLIFIGPKAETIRNMGNKILARGITKDCNIATIPGSEKAEDFKGVLEVADEIGSPFILKAVGGGGGRGMMIVNKLEELEAIFNTVAAEVESAFGDRTLYVEKYFPNARHIEVQIVGDHFGNMIHLGERECSIQRRYQKMIEEAPSPIVSDELRKKVCSAAVTIGKSIHYEGAGTVEFVLDCDTGRYYFLEMNTRIQVEHPVTEQISGIDLVKEQIIVAALQPLSIVQEEVNLAGHAIECRVNAESVERNFQPCPGEIKRWVEPHGAGIRIDSHCYAGYKVPPFYDSLLAKVIVNGSNRSEAIERMVRALKDFVIYGVNTNVPFLHHLLTHSDFRKANVNTRWVEDVFLPNYDIERDDLLN